VRQGAPRLCGELRYYTLRQAQESLVARPRNQLHSPRKRHRARPHHSSPARQHGGELTSHLDLQGRQRVSRRGHEPDLVEKGADPLAGPLPPRPPRKRPAEPPLPGTTLQLRQVRHRPRGRRDARANSLPGSARGRRVRPSSPSTGRQARPSRPHPSRPGCRSSPVRVRGDCSSARRRARPAACSTLHKAGQETSDLNSGANSRLVFVIQTSFPLNRAYQKVSTKSRHHHGRVPYH